jgi:glutamine amidotransferase
MITIIDYNAGNVKSVTNALDTIGREWKVTSKSKDIARASKIIMPGVGSAKAAMGELRRRGLVELMKNIRAPFLGICLGMQVLFEWSEEGDTDCLGIIKGRVKKFQGKGLKVPQTGWNTARVQSKKFKVKNYRSIFEGVKNGAYFYFVHSYYCVPENREVVTATTEYGVEFAAAVQQNNFYGVQFHPEKSGDSGMKLLAHFCGL